MRDDAPTTTYDGHDALQYPENYHEVEFEAELDHIAFLECRELTNVEKAALGEDAVPGCKLRKISLKLTNTRRFILEHLSGLPFSFLRD